MKRSIYLSAVIASLLVTSVARADNIIECVGRQFGDDNAIMFIPPSDLISTTCPPIWTSALLYCAVTSGNGAYVEESLIRQDAARVLHAAKNGQKAAVSPLLVSYAGLEHGEREFDLHRFSREVLKTPYGDIASRIESAARH